MGSSFTLRARLKCIRFFRLRLLNVTAALAASAGQAVMAWALSIQLPRHRTRKPREVALTTIPRSDCGTSSSAEQKNFLGEMADLRGEG